MQINDRVYDIEGDMGTVTAVVPLPDDENDNLVTITWDGEGGPVAEYEGEDDLSDSGIEVMDASLEADFKQIQSKLLEAAKLVREAIALAENNATHIDFTDWQFANVCGANELIGAIDDAGWSTSSLSC